MKELRHENLSAFLGASLEAGAAFVLSPYCARGSLQDILQDEDLQLDGVFVSSLVADLIRVRTSSLLACLCPPWWQTSSG